MGARVGLRCEERKRGDAEHTFRWAVAPLANVIKIRSLFQGHLPVG